MANPGFQPIDNEDHAALLIEYALEGMGTAADLNKSSHPSCLAPCPKVQLTHLLAPQPHGNMLNVSKA
jgi:hypothetical protein